MRRCVTMLACVVVLGGTVTAGGAELFVRVWDREDHQGQVQLRMGDAEPIRIEFRGTDKDSQLGPLKLPRDAQTVTLTGDFRWKHFRRGAQHDRGTQTLRVVDLSPAMLPLRNAKLPFGARIKQFEAARTALEARHPAFADGPFATVEFGEPGPAQAVEAAERRLGFKLPADYVDLVKSLGQVRIDDSSTTPIGQVRNAWDQMVQDWETPERVLRGLAPATQQLLRSGTILFTEVGDGYSALLYHPGLQDVCAGKPALYWIHADEINRPRVLQKLDGTCRDFAESMVWVIAQLVLARYDDLGPDVVLVDHSCPTRVSYSLLRDYDRRGFFFELSPEWDRFE